LALKLPAEGSPVSGSHRVLNLDITPERMDDAVEALRELIGRLPDHPSVLPLTAVSVADGRLVVVTPPVTGDALDDALQLYGPAAVDDALPRLRQLATALDVIARAGRNHGALHPHDIIVSADDTLIAGCGVAGALSRVGVAVPLDPRYAAPEVLETGEGTPAGDQYSLAVIAHEWMFGSAVALADGFLRVPAIAGLDVSAMQRAFDAATAIIPAERFDSCGEFCAALERSAGVAPMVELDRAADVTELPLRGDAGFAAAPGNVFSGADAPSSPQRQFGMPAMIATLLLGVVIGAAAMWRLGGLGVAQSGEQPQQFTDASMAPVASTPEPTEVVDAPVTPARDDRQAAEPSPPMPDVARAAQADAGLLIHSTPAGATVTIDGIERGVTPTHQPQQSFARGAAIAETDRCSRPLTDPHRRDGRPQNKRSNHARRCRPRSRARLSQSAETVPADRAHGETTSSSPRSLRLHDRAGVAPCVVGKRVAVPAPAGQVFGANSFDLCKSVV
jgi:hypothetical protein